MVANFLSSPKKDQADRGWIIALTHVQRLKASIVYAATIDTAVWKSTQQDVYKLMSHDRFVQFKNSDMYLEYLDSLTDPMEADKWAQNMDALLSNPVCVFIPYTR